MGFRCEIRLIARYNLTNSPGSAADFGAIAYLLPRKAETRTAKGALRKPQQARICRHAQCGNHAGRTLVGDVGEIHLRGAKRITRDLGAVERDTATGRSHRSCQDRGQDRLRGAGKIYERTLDRHINNLRQKLESDSRRPQHIVTVYGVGYKLQRS